MSDEKKPGEDVAVPQEIESILPPPPGVGKTPGGAAVPQEIESILPPPPGVGKSPGGKEK